MLNKNIPLSNNIISLWWGFIDESYDINVISKYFNESLTDYWFELLQYNSPYWLEFLRISGVNFLNKYFLNKNINKDNLLITNWATSWIDLVWRYILKGKYDSIIFTPTYDTAIESLKINSNNIYNVDLSVFSSDILDMNWIKLLEKKLSIDSVKLLYINTNFQNPTWLIFTESLKKEIYNLCKKYNVYILEDDPYKLYNFDSADLGSNFIDFDDNLSNVIYINSISKVFFPWVRIWFIVWNEKVLLWISNIQKYTTSSANLLMQWLAHKALINWEIDKSIIHYLNIISKKRTLIINLMKKYGLFDIDCPINITDSKWWFYFWIEFKDKSINTTILLDEAYKKGIWYVPWEIYYPDLWKKNWLRIAFAKVDVSEIEEAVLRLSNLINNK